MNRNTLEGKLAIVLYSDANADIESWIELNGQDRAVNNDTNEVTTNVETFEESEYIEEGILNDGSSMVLSDGEETDEGVYTPMEQSENDLDQSLNTLINGDKVQANRSPNMPRYKSSKVTLESLRLVNDNDIRTAFTSDTSSISSSGGKRKRKPKPNDHNPLDLSSSIALAAAAGISIVAGLSFSAGYAFGRRSVKIVA